MNFTKICLTFGYYVYLFVFQIKVFSLGNFSSPSFRICILLFHFSIFFFRNPILCVLEFICLSYLSLSNFIYVFFVPYYFYDFFKLIITFTVICTLLCSFGCFCYDYFVFPFLSWATESYQLVFLLVVVSWFFFFFCYFDGLFYFFLLFF